MIRGKSKRVILRDTWGANVGENLKHEREVE